VQGVLAELGHPLWQVAVSEGVARLTGPGTDRERAAAEAAALSVPGVRRVHVDDPPAAPDAEGLSRRGGRP
jgi:hypothetical protein